MAVATVVAVVVAGGMGDAVDVAVAGVVTVAVAVVAAAADVSGEVGAVAVLIGVAVAVGAARGRTGFDDVPATTCATVVVTVAFAAVRVLVAGTAAMAATFVTALALVCVNCVAIVPLTAMNATTLVAVTPFFQHEILRMVSAFACCAARGSLGAGLPKSLSLLDILVALSLQ